METELTTTTTTHGTIIYVTFSNIIFVVTTNTIVIVVVLVVHDDGCFGVKTINGIVLVVVFDVINCICCCYVANGIVVLTDIININTFPVELFHVRHWFLNNIITTKLFLF